MNNPKVTPKDFFLWAGAMVALYWSVVAFIFLIFDYINYSFPDPLAYYPSDPYQGGISYEMASIIVLFPIYVGLMWVIRNDIWKDATRKDIWVRRWALLLTLFVAGATIAGDLILLLTAFLNGEALTTAFLLKVLLVFLVAAGGFMHFIADMWGYWDQYPRRKQIVCTAVGVLAAVSIIAGFFIVGTPAQARLARFDDQKVIDLQSIQWQVVNYWQAKQKLPVALADLNDPIKNWMVPTDPQEGNSYTYKATGKLSFQLCATFNAQTRGSAQVMGRETVPVPIGATGKPLADSWQHGVGEVCFDRTIDPQLYPPSPKGL